MSYNVTHGVGQNVGQNDWPSKETIMGKLTVLKAKAMTKVGLHADGGTLFLRVAPGGSRQWIQRISINRKRHDLGLGSFPHVSLQRAREKAFANKTAVLNGKDILSERRKEQTMLTFEQATERYYEENQKGWRENYRKRWGSALYRYAMPRLGCVPVNRMTSQAVLDVLLSIWSKRSAQARILRQRIRSILEWAQAHGLVMENVAGECIEGGLPSTPAVKEHHRALPYADLPKALRMIDESQSSLSVRLCFRFIALTACRSGEARFAKWSEVDMENRIWNIPKERMKMKHDFRVPLSTVAIAVLEQAATLRDSSDLIFPSTTKRGVALSDMAVSAVLKRVGLAEQATVHGLRSGFRNWAAEKTNADYATMEMSLAHAVGNTVERSYASSDLYEKRKILMQQWGDFLEQRRADVVNLY